MRKHLLRLSGLLLLGAILQLQSSAQVTGPSSSQSPYVIPAAPGVQTTSILTAGDAVNGYKMAGIPDGSGAYDNGDGTFTFLVNHEIPAAAGAVRAHGATGAFVSRWIVSKSNLAILSGSDLIRNVNLWNGSGYVMYNAANTSPLARFGRFCSADLPPVSAFYNSTNGKGTMERIFMNGEETGAEGRAFGHIATGANTGTSYELPALGKMSWENAVAHPSSGDKTIVIGLDDATPGQVYVYIGTKQNSGNEVERAGLTNGMLHGVAVSGLLLETSASVPAPNTPFSLPSLADVRNMTGAAINAASNIAGITNFLRPEDGAWDPMHPEDFYFVTTNTFNGPSRLWKLHFTNINDLTQGGTITAVLDGTEGQKMLDNITIDQWGHILMQEDVGNNPHNGKIWQYKIATDELKLIAKHDPARFGDIGMPSVAPYNQDEEASGIIDAQEILGAGMFLMTDQTHYPIPGELYEGGQLLAMFNPDTYNACANYSGNVSISPSPAVANHLANTIYLGYGPQSVKLTASVLSGFPPYTYSWSNGATSNEIMVSPTTTTTFSVTIKNAFGCAITLEQTVNVMDVRDGDKKIFVCHKGKTQSISVNAVPAHLAQGSMLGACSGEEMNNKGKSRSKMKDVPMLFPNPTHHEATLSIKLMEDARVAVSIVDMEGKTVMKPVNQTYKSGSHQIRLNTAALTKGTYFVQVNYGNEVSKIKMVVIR